MNWLSYTLISVFLGAVVQILQRVMMKEKSSDPYVYSVVFQLLVAIVIGGYAYSTGNLVFNNLGKMWFSLALMTLLYVLGNISVFTALKQTEASKFAVVFASRALFSTFGFVVFMKQPYGDKELLGSVLILLSVILVNWQRGTLSFSKYDVPVLLAGFFFGAENVNDRIILGSISLYPFVLLSFLLPSITMFLLRPGAFIISLKLFDKRTTKRMLLVSSLYAAGAITFFKALQITQYPSKVVVVYLLSVVLTVLMGIIFLKERQNARLKLLGALISLVGVYLVS